MGVASIDLYVNLAESHNRKAEAVPDTAREELSKAIAVFEEALQRPFPDESLAEIHHRLARIFAADRGIPDSERRRQHARKALALDPEHSEKPTLESWARDE